MGASAGFWWTPVASRCRSPSAGPTGMTAICWAPPWELSSVPGRDRGNGQMETLCADASDVGFPALATSRVHNYQLNVKTRRQESDEKRNHPGHQARRWVVERTHRSEEHTSELQS